MGTSTTKGFNTFTVEADISLLRNDDIFSRDDDTDNYNYYLPLIEDLDNKTYKELREFCKTTVESPDNLLLHLFYTGEQSFRGMQLIVLENPKCVEEDGRFVFKTLVKYTFPAKVSETKLKKEVNYIFQHYSNGGDVEYGLSKFNILNSKNENTYSFTEGKKVYYNLL